MRQVMTIEDSERDAYIKGDTAAADLLARIAELENEISQLQHEVKDTYSLDEWDIENGPADEYRDFFHTCFACLKNRYPGPSVTSDYDKQVIFDAIIRGESHE